MQNLREILSRRNGSKKIGSLSKRTQDGKKVALLIDGPNILDEDSEERVLKDIREITMEIGDLRVVKVILNQYSTDRFVEEVSNQGFEPIVVSGETGVRLSIEAMRYMYKPYIDIIAIATTNHEFLTIFNRARGLGKETMLISTGDVEESLNNASDYVATIEQGGE